MPVKVSIMDEEWDYLIVLDACRYDYFSKLCGDYLQGILEKVYSPASHTLEWCKKSFKEYYNDVVYVSANPYINSKVKIRGFNAKNHFFKIIDVWNWGWDEDLGTVHPEKVNEAVQKLKDKHPDKRFIIHYLQPHAPYLSYNLNGGFPKPQITRGHVLTGIRNNKTNKILEKSLNILGFLAKKIGLFGGNPSWKIRELLNLPPASPMDAVRRRYGDIGLRQAYVGNLKIVLEHIAELVKSLSGVIIVTADHGELLGEDGCYSHHPRSTNPLLREIPWFTIEKKEKRRSIGEKKRITQKIKRLKALNLI